LQQLPELRRQFEIDNHLSRFTKALKNLYTLNAHEEIRAYVVKHVLYKEALELYKYQNEQQREITELYADYLQDQSKYKDAAIGK
jgi:elongator complex protein 1